TVSRWAARPYWVVRESRLCGLLRTGPPYPLLLPEYARFSPIVEKMGNGIVKPYFINVKVFFSNIRQGEKSKDSAVKSGSGVGEVGEPASADVGQRGQPGSPPQRLGARSLPLWRHGALSGAAV